MNFHGALRGNAWQGPAAAVSAFIATADVGVAAFMFVLQNTALTACRRRRRRRRRRKICCQAHCCCCGFYNCRLLPPLAAAAAACCAVAAAAAAVVADAAAAVCVTEATFFASVSAALTSRFCRRHRHRRCHCRRRSCGCCQIPARGLLRLNGRERPAHLGQGAERRTVPVRYDLSPSTRNRLVTHWEAPTAHRLHDEHLFTFFWELQRTSN